LAYKKLKLVDHLVDYLPFGSGTGNLYEENAQPDESSWSYETKTLNYVRSLLRDPSVSLVVLTGDAGHGKTHLCRRILEGQGLSPEDAISVLTSDPNAQQAIEPLEEGGLKLRIVKDFSEGSVEAKTKLLIELLEDPESVGLVCANEGRLRATVSAAEGDLDNVMKALEFGLNSGLTTADGHVHVVNLNFQAAAPTEKGFLRHMLRHWVDDRRRWGGCQQCDAKDSCPILKNRTALTTDDPHCDNRMDGLLQLVRTVEQSGYVFTIREALIFLAYIITGGNRCSDIHELHRSSRGRVTLSDHQMVPLLFKRKLESAESQNLSVVRRIRRCDPGLITHRDVDEKIVRDLDDFSASSGDQPTASQQKQEALRLLETVQSERRNSFFVDPEKGADGVIDRARRLGLFHYQPFEHIQSDDERASKMREIIKQIVLGLHVIQGIRPRDRSSLYLVDPAYSRSGSHTSVIAVKIPIDELWLRGLHEYWAKESGEEEKVVPLVQSVDWLDRQVVLCRDSDESQLRLLSLDLFQFEFVLRSADGVVFPQFHAADRRRILTALAAVAEQKESVEKDITFVVEDSIRKIVVARDGYIEVYNNA
jgi:hypothetical protein